MDLFCRRCSLKQTAITVIAFGLVGLFLAWVLSW